jgi:preprotein translocase SecF subunit
MNWLFKGVDFFPHGTRFPILEFRNIFVGLTLAAAVLSAVLIMTRGLNYGVDFKGGSLIEVKAKSGQIDVAKLRDTLSKLGVGEPQVQGVGDAEALIRLAQQPGADEAAESRAQDAANKAVTSAVSKDHDVRRIEVVGPAVSQELKATAVWAIIASIIGIAVYVWFRFEWQFAVAAIVALLHDVFITTGLFSLLWYEFDLSVVAALLTLAGYSINDTVVIFDRVRENMRKYKKMDMVELLNLSLNETLSRTTLTAGVTAIAVLALYLFGTTVIEAFTFAMLFGIVIGTYSSIFIAAPILLWLGVQRETVVGEEKPVGVTTKA